MESILSNLPGIGCQTGWTDAGLTQTFRRNQLKNLWIYDEGIAPAGVRIEAVLPVAAIGLMTDGADGFLHVLSPYFSSTHRAIYIGSFTSLWIIGSTPYWCVISP